ncbi:MAG: OB-fold protein [Flavobacterium sp.]
MTRKFKLLLGSFVGLLLSIIALYFYIYKSHRDIASENVAFETSVSELSQRFINNPDSSTATYADQTVSIYGNVTALDLKQNSITLDDKLIALVAKEEIGKVKKGDLVKVKGRFIGYDELFEELRMDQCIVED